MHVPRYWAHAINPRNGSLLWRSSGKSVADAQAIVDELASRLENSSKKYVICKDDRTDMADYPRPTVFREMLIEEHKTPDGQTDAFLSRNLAGSLVMNYRDLLILDWDLPPGGHFYIIPTFMRLWRTLCHVTGRLFGSEKQEILRRRYPWLFNIDWDICLQKSYIRLKMSRGTGQLPYKPIFPKYNRPIDILRPLLKFLKEHNDWSVRVYQTAWGYRGIVTHERFDPTDESTLDLMKQFHCDRRYIDFCKFQGSFRARVSPKPFRCGFQYAKIAKGFRFRYPCIPEDKYSEELYTKAVQIYENKSRDYAVCRYLGTLGSEQIHPTLYPLIEQHDMLTLVPKSVRSTESHKDVSTNEYPLA